jgi:exopolyphosphatase/guanosine-5'-triphosphate,3'-diphosphate pyrophosphatase
MLEDLDGDPDCAIGSSGTISTVAALAAARRGNGDVDRFTAAELDALVDDLTGTDVEDRRGFDGLDERRVDIIVGGAVLLQGIFRAFAIPSMRVSPYALREGVLYDRFDKTPGHARLADLRRSNVRRLATQLDPDVDHAETASRLALQIFDQTTEVHWLGASARELLELAALVHNVGLFISHASHHKHTYYVVRHSEHLTGFTEREREVLALTARYHRKSHPKARHPEFSALSKGDQELVRKLAGILRVAIGLDRSHRGLVDRVDVEVGTDRLLLRAVPVGDANLDLEMYAARQRADLLADALDVEVEIVSQTG